MKALSAPNPVPAPPPLYLLSHHPLNLIILISLKEPPSCSYVCRLDEVLKHCSPFWREEEGARSCLPSDSGRLSFVLVDSAPQEEVLHILNSLGTLALGGAVT